MNKYITADGEIDVKDIMYTLTGALPAAIDSLDRVPDLSIVFNSPNIPIAAANFLRERVTYKEDGLSEQVIQLPTALFDSKIGDCKSFALFIASVLTAAGISNGFRFVAYTPGEFTHVYNYYLGSENNIIYLDACNDDFKEYPRYSKVQDMQVSIIGRTPIVHKSGTRIGSRVNGLFSRLSMFPARRAFRTLIALNFRGNAYALKRGVENGRGDLIRQWWENFGGDYSELLQSINAGAARNPVLGRGDAYDDAYARENLEGSDSQRFFTELYGNAVLMGFPDVFNGQPINLSNPQIFATVARSLVSFFNDLGITTMNQLQNSYNTITNPPPVYTPAPGSGPGKTIGAVETATVATAVGIAIPLLTVLPGLLRSLGVPEGDFLEGLDNAAQTAGGYLPPDTPIVPGPPDSGPGGIAGGVSLTTLLLFGGAAYLLLRKKR